MILKKIIMILNKIIRFIMKKIIYLFFLFFFSFLHGSVDPASICSREKILICGVAKNVERAIPITIKSIEALGACFEDYEVIIYENNSCDKTKEKFRAWSDKNSKVTFISENISQHLPRTEMIARARNIVLDVAMKSKYDDFKYLLMADLDFLHEWDIQGILSSFSFDEDWDAIAANGILLKTALPFIKPGSYVDYYAFRDETYPLGPELLNSYWLILTDRGKDRRFTLLPSDPFYKVYSAFGGLAIYKRSSIKECKYSGSVTEDMKIFTKEIMETYGNKYCAQINEYFQDNQNRDSFKKGILRFRGTAVCEHCALYASMALKGHNKIFINPRMIMVYEE